MFITSDSMPLSKKAAFNKAGVKSLLSVNADSKTVKGTKKGYLTGILYLAPHNTVTSSKVKTICPNAVRAGCATACLYTAGRGAFDNVKAGRIKRTESFLSDREAFMVALWYDVQALVKKAAKELVRPCVRLNGTSDISWNTIAFTAPNGITGSIMEHFPNVQFYEYTKQTKQAYKVLPDNYNLTVSYSEASTWYAADAVQAAMNNNKGLAVVFRDRLPARFLGMPVIDADETDLRFLDRDLFNIAGPYIVGLKAKGQARSDKSGFVVDL